MGTTRLNKMGHRSSYARLSTLGTTRIDYCEPEEHASIVLTAVPSSGPALPVGSVESRRPYPRPCYCFRPNSILL